MAKTRVKRAGIAPKSKVELIHDKATKKHAKRPDLLELIEIKTWEFQKRERSGEIVDLSAAVQQYSDEIERLGVRTPIPPKDRGLKTGPIVKTVAIRRVHGPKATSGVRKGKKQTGMKRQRTKRTYVK